MIRQLVRPIFNVSNARRFSDVKPPKKGGKDEAMKGKTPQGSLDRSEEDRYEDPHLRKHPGGVNKQTGEVGGPAGPEPTRYGDWERKGRVSDF